MLVYFLQEADGHPALQGMSRLLLSGLRHDRACDEEERKSRPRQAFQAGSEGGLDSTDSLCASGTALEEMPEISQAGVPKILRHSYSMPLLLQQQVWLCDLA